MIHKAWCSIEDMPYYFFGVIYQISRSHGRKIGNLNPIWVRLLGRSQLSNPSDLPCFSCDHTVLRTLLSIRLSVHPSVSVTPFPQCPCHHIMKFSAVITFDKSDVHTKGEGEMSFISRGSLLFIFKASSKFQGHLGQKIYKMFPHCKSSLNSQMAMK